METRTPKSTEAKLEEIAKATTLATATLATIELIEQFYRREEKRATRYDEKTGSPVEFNWFPYERFRYDLRVDGENTPDIRLSTSALTELKALPPSETVLIKTPLGNYTIGHEVRSEVTYADHFSTFHGNQEYLNVRKLRFE